MSFLILIYFAAFLVALTVGYIKWAQLYWKRNSIPYLEPEFFYGNVREFLKKELSFGDMFTVIYNEIKTRGWKYGGFYFFTKPSLMVIDIDLIKHIVVKDFPYFMNHGVYVNEEADPLTGNLFNLEDSKWKSMRVKLTPTFTSGKLKTMLHTMAACTEGLEDLLRECENLNAAVDIKEILSRFTTDVIGSVAFGIDCRSLKDPNSEFREYGKRVFERQGFKRRLKAIIGTVLPRSLLIKVGFKQTDDEIERFFMNLVKDTIKFRENNNIVRKDFMQLMLQLKNRGTVDDDDSALDGHKLQKGTFLTENEISAQCFVFFLAGFETSATTMTFALYELAVNQTVQDKLRDEIQTVLSKYDNMITYEGIMEMPYLDRVVHETLRKHPPVAGLPRICTKDYKIPGTDTTIRKGTRVHIPVQGIHKDPEHYPNPDLFDPERFNEENKNKRQACTFLPFGEGPRICIGARFGLLQAKVGLTAVIRKFKVTLNEKTLTPLSYGTNVFITAPKGGLWLNVHEIK